MIWWEGGRRPPWRRRSPGERRLARGQFRGEEEIWTGLKERWRRERSQLVSRGKKPGPNLSFNVFYSLDKS